MSELVDKVARDSEEFWDSLLEKTINEQADQTLSLKLEVARLEAKCGDMEKRVMSVEGRMEKMEAQLEGVGLKIDRISNNDMISREFVQLQQLFATHRGKSYMNNEFMHALESHFNEFNKAVDYHFQESAKELPHLIHQIGRHLNGSQQLFTVDTVSQVLKENLRAYQAQKEKEEDEARKRYPAPQYHSPAYHGAADMHMAAPWPLYQGVPHTIVQPSSTTSRDHWKKSSSKHKSKSKSKSKGDIVMPSPHGSATGEAALRKHHQGPDPKMRKNVLKSDRSAFSDASGSTSTRENAERASAALPDPAPRPSSMPSLRTQNR